MIRKLPKLKQFNIVVLVLGLLFGPLSIYYFFYFSSQKNYFINRNFRLLSSLGSGLENKVDAVGRAYMRAAKKAAPDLYRLGSSAGKCEQSEKPQIDKALHDALIPVTDSQQANRAGMERVDPAKATFAESLDVRPDGASQQLVFRYISTPIPNC